MPASRMSAFANAFDASICAAAALGPKTAKLIVLSLAGKLAAVAPAAADGGDGDGGTVPASVRADVVLALIGLGWAERVAAEAVDTVAEGVDASAGVPVLLRLALAHLGPTGGQR